MKMGKGTFYLLIAEVMFVVSGWAIHIGAGRILGREYYGIFVILLSLLTLYRIFLQTGVNRAVSKYTSEEPARARLIRRQALKLQFSAGIFFGVLVWLAARPLAQVWQKEELVGYIRLTAFFLPVFGVYSVYRGSLNGQKLFDREARISIAYSLLKVIFLFTLIHLFADRVIGAVSGYLLAVIAAMVMARWSCPPAELVPGETFPILRIVSFAVPVVLLSFSVSLIQSLDLFFLRALEGSPLTDQATSFYGCAQQFAKIPYMILYALSLTLFPTIAAHTARAGSEHITASTIRRALRAGLLISLPAAALIGGSARELIAWIYPKINGGGGALEILIFGQTALALLFVLTTILTAAGRARLSFALMGAALILDAALNRLLIPGFGLPGAAAATTLASLAGMALAGAGVFKNFRALIPPLSALRIPAAAALLFIAARWWGPEGWALPAAFIILGAGYILLLLLIREIDRNDWKMIKSLIIKKPE